MSNFGKKYRKDPIKKFYRDRDSKLNPRKKKNTVYSKRKNKPVEISGKEFLFWLVLIVIGSVFS